jgi:hypothetical protein
LNNPFGSFVKVVFILFRFYVFGIASGMAINPKPFAPLPDG